MGHMRHHLGQGLLLSDGRSEVQLRLLNSYINKRRQRVVGHFAVISNVASGWTSLGDGDLRRSTVHLLVSHNWLSRSNPSLTLLTNLAHPRSWCGRRRCTSWRRPTPCWKSTIRGQKNLQEEKETLVCTTTKISRVVKKVKSRNECRKCSVSQTKEYFPAAK